MFIRRAPLDLPAGRPKVGQHSREGARRLEYRFTIGQVAKTSGVAATTIRYYEQIGVLPVPRRSTSGYRLYDEPDAERLKFIHRARSLGLPLQHLKILMSTLNGRPRPQLRPRLRALVGEQLDAVKGQIAELEVLRQQLEHVLDRMRAPARRRAGGACQCLEPREPPSGGPRREARAFGTMLGRELPTLRRGARRARRTCTTQPMGGAH
ncbi:MAG: MerR family transcriptional regulator [Candidatus Rokuibacteriota bacterium]